MAPITMALIKVPKKAKVIMVPKLRKNFDWLSSYPLDKMIGGRSTFSIIVLLKRNISRTGFNGPSRNRTPTIIPANKPTIVSCTAVIRFIFR